ncbi:MAG: hypothetical protein AAF850_03545 [Pseudomonadota bacterium]
MVEYVSIELLLFVLTLTIGGALISAFADAAVVVSCARSLADRDWFKSAMRNARATVSDWDEKSGRGHVIANGERWRATADGPLNAGDMAAGEMVVGDPVDILSATGLTLHIRKKKT